MQNLFIKIKKAINEIEEKKGDFLIKCLVTRDAEDVRWTLVLCADWLDKDLMKRMEYLTSEILKDIDNKCMIDFAGIITIDKGSEFGKFLIDTQDNYEKYKERSISSFGNEEPITIGEFSSEYAKWVIPIK